MQKSGETLNASRPGFVKWQKATRRPFRQFRRVDQKCSTTSKTPGTCPEIGFIALHPQEMTVNKPLSLHFRNIVIF
jgi:hypothetical protein